MERSPKERSIGHTGCRKVGRTFGPDFPSIVHVLSTPILQPKSLGRDNLVASRHSSSQLFGCSNTNRSGVGPHSGQVWPEGCLDTWVAGHNHLLPWIWALQVIRGGTHLQNTWGIGQWQY